MAAVTCPSNVVSATFAGSGLITAAGGKLSGITQAEAQSLTGANRQGVRTGNEWYGLRISATTNMSTGTVDMLCPATITTLTLASGAIVVSGGKLPNVPASDATLLSTQGFQLFSA